MGVRAQAVDTPAPDPIQHFQRISSAHERHVEQRSRRSPHRLRAVRVNRTFAADYSSCSGSFGYSEDRAEIAGIAHVHADHEELNAPELVQLYRCASHDGRDRLRGDSVGDALEHAGRKLVTLGPTFYGLRDNGLIGAGRHKHVEDVSAARERFGEKLGALDDERAFVPARRPFFEEASEALDRRTAAPELRQEACCAPSATLTRAAKAASSCTARSARIFRSTSMPAWRRPLMKRL